MNREQAIREFWKSLRWIVSGAVVLVFVALGYLAYVEELRLHMVIATVLGVFVSFSLGAGLFALAFFSDKSGHDREVSDVRDRRSDKTD